MANDTLRAALEHAGLGLDDLAQIVQVDVRTVRRWLSGGTPYPRQRGKVARALDTTEHELWPEIATAAPPSPPAVGAGDILAGYPAAGDLDAPDLVALMRDATDRIDLLGDTLISTLGTPGVPELLASKATQGCAVRILVFDTHHHVPALMNQPGVEIRLLEDPAAYTIHRYDDELLLTLHAIGRDADHAPLIHIRRAAPEAMFERLADYYDDLWEHDSQPLRPGLELPPHEHEDEDEHPESDPPLPAGEQAGAGDSERSPSPPRRWPRRP